MVTAARAARWSRLAALLLLLAGACGRSTHGEADAVEATIRRYDELLRDGYERQSMAFMAEVATRDQAEKLYAHMAALGEGGLRLSARLGLLEFVRVALPDPGEATVETREVWDFTHYRIATGEKVAEERGFVYRNAYRLRREGVRWLVTSVDVIAGEPTNTVISWPTVERRGRVGAPGHASEPAPR